MRIAGDSRARRRCWSRSTASPIPRNLGAIVRSAAAFGAHGVLVPERRSAGMTASAWRTSAGTAARHPGRPVHQPGPHPQGLGRRRVDDRRPRRRRHRRHRRLRAGHRTAGAGGRLGGPRAGPADPHGLRRHRVDPDGPRPSSRSTRRSPPAWCWPRWPGGAGPSSPADAGPRPSLCCSGHDDARGGPVPPRASSSFRRIC